MARLLRSFPLIYFLTFLLFAGSLSPPFLTAFYTDLAHAFTLFDNSLGLHERAQLNGLRDVLESVTDEEPALLSTAILFSRLFPFSISFRKMIEDRVLALIGLRRLAAIAT